MKKLILAVVMLGMAMTLLGQNATSASFTDQVRSTGNTFTAASLVAPVLAVPTVSGTGATAQVSLSWTAPTFATSWDVLRLTGACGTPSTVVTTVATTSTTNVPGAAGTYCYAIRGKYATNWVSPLSNSQQVTVGVGTLTLKLNSPNPPTAGSDATSTLTTGAVSGGRNIAAKTNPPFNFGLWHSDATRTATSTSGWSITLKVAHTSGSAVDAKVTIDVWIDSSASCATGPTAVNRYASLVSTVVLGAGPFTFNLSAGTAVGSQTGTLCLMIQNSDGNSGAPHDMRVVTDGVSVLQGPVN